MKPKSQLERRRSRAAVVYLETKDVAELLGWDTARARYWLKRDKAAVKRGGRWYATESRLRATFPEAFEDPARVAAVVKRSSEKKNLPRIAAKNEPLLLRHALRRLWLSVVISKRCVAKTSGPARTEQTEKGRAPLYIGRV